MLWVCTVLTSYNVGTEWHVVLFTEEASEYLELLDYTKNLIAYFFNIFNK